MQRYCFARIILSTFAPAARSVRLGFASLNKQLRILGTEPEQRGGAEAEDIRIARKGRSEKRHERPSEEDKSQITLACFVWVSHGGLSLSESARFAQFQTRNDDGWVLLGKTKKKFKGEGIDKTGHEEESNQLQKTASISHPGK